MWVLLCSLWLGAWGSSLTPAMMEGTEPLQHPDAMNAAAQADQLTPATDMRLDDNVENDEQFADIMNTVKSLPPTTETPHPSKRVLLAVMTAPANVANRLAIRDTWASLTHHNSLYGYSTIKYNLKMEVKFFVGQSDSEPIAHDVDTEVETFPDMVKLADLHESYHNLTRKTALMMAYAHTQGYEVMFKLDDDDFVQVDLFAAALHQIKDTTDLYWGRIRRNVSVIRDPASKWFDSYPSDEYPTYMLGSGYVVGQKILETIANLGVDKLHLFENEDASVGIWTKDLGIEPRPMRQMVLQPWCDDEAIVVNGVEPNEQYTLMENKMQHASICARSFYLQICRQEPCKCCVNPTQPDVQSEGVCCY
eukprot:c45534_g1_i1.p1 GENE.c45534_g1_i1~~c45534_g1_i1.p1  ORF type:complete len:377 (+),score=85.59 c45534_g1_i1:42-1133(+)